jgi:hypothetical protein
VGGSVAGPDLRHHEAMRDSRVDDYLNSAPDWQRAVMQHRAGGWRKLKKR